MGSGWFVLISSRFSRSAARWHPLCSRSAQRFAGSAFGHSQPDFSICPHPAALALWTPSCRQSRWAQGIGHCCPSAWAQAPVQVSTLHLCSCSFSLPGSLCDGPVPARGMWTQCASRSNTMGTGWRQPGPTTTAPGKKEALLCCASSAGERPGGPRGGGGGCHSTGCPVGPRLVPGPSMAWLLSAPGTKGPAPCPRREMPPQRPSVPARLRGK